MQEKRRAFSGLDGGDLLAVVVLPPEPLPACLLVTLPTAVHWVDVDDSTPVGQAIAGLLTNRLDDPDIRDTLHALAGRTHDAHLRASDDRPNFADRWQTLSLTVAKIDPPGTLSLILRAQSQTTTGKDTIVSAKRSTFPAKENEGARDLVDQQASSQLERLVTALDSFPHPFALFDRDDCLVIANAAYKTSMSGDENTIKEGMALREIVRIALESGKLKAHSEDLQAAADAYMARANPSAPVLDMEFEGDIHHRVIRNVTAAGDIVVVRLETTELVRQRRAAQAAEDRLLAALNAYPDPFAIYDSNDCIVVWNNAYRASMTDDPDYMREGLHRTEIAEHAIRSGKFVDALGKEDQWAFAEHQTKDIAKPVQDLALAGDIHHRLQRTRVENGDLVFLRTDITELVRQRREVEAYAQKLEAANQEISYKAQHDQLTGLANRRSLSQRFDEMIDRYAEGDRQLGAITLDLDRFKFINDTMGHQAGDAVLIEVGRRIDALLTENELVARIGGDEFVILVDRTYIPTRVDDLATAILFSLDRPIQLVDGVCRVGASIGSARTPVSPADQLIVHSDVALYKAKSGGRGQIAAFEQSDLDDIRAKAELADEIRRAVKNKEFVPFYQPQIDAATGCVIGLEALARWDHPVEGILPPYRFLDMAVELGILEKIDAQIFDQALIDCTTYFEGADVYPNLSFNISDKRIFTDLKKIEAQAGSYPGKVSFELLESIVFEEQGDDFLFQIACLRAVGIEIEIDDFGSGHASVVALQRVAPDRLKIDRRLTAQIAKDGNGHRLLKAMIEIGHSLNIDVTAEGVETDLQAQVLTELGCDRLQGYLYAQPMPLEALHRTMSRDLTSCWPQQSAQSAPSA